MFFYQIVIYKVVNSIDRLQPYYNMHFSFQTILNCFSLGMVLPIFSQILKLDDLTITTICLGSGLGSLVCILIAKIPEVLYLSAAIKIFSEMTTTSIRSGITKIVGRQDVGKVRVVIAKLYTLPYNNNFVFTRCLLNK